MREERLDYGNVRVNVTPRRLLDQPLLPEVAMRNLFLLAILIILLPALAGCGGGSSQPFTPSVFVASILSDQPSDGDIAFDPVLNLFTITNGPGTLFFGIDGADPNRPEFRAFLDFPLDGTTGEDVVPINATILSATLEVFVNEVSFAAIFPALIDLVVYPVAGLRVADFSSPQLLTQAVDFFPADVGTLVPIDVTLLMREAQRLGLADFQVRFLLDPLAATGLVGIDDLPAVILTAPLLTVNYTL